MKLDSLPIHFKPYKELEIANNKIIDGIVLLIVNDFIPLIVGKGNTPEVWINIPSDKKGESWQPLVRRNRSLHKDISVESSFNLIKVSTPNEVILEVKDSSQVALEREKPIEDKAIITKLDLRPFGINVFLKGKELIVYGNSIVGNTFVGAKAMLSINDSKT